MKTEDEVREFLENIQWERFTKKELEKALQVFFGTTNKLMKGTDDDAPRGIDHSYLFTTESDSYFSNLIDLKIWYCNSRKGEKLITGTEILEYIE